MPGLAPFIVISLHSPAGKSADTGVARAGSGSCIVCEWVMPARVDAQVVESIAPKLRRKTLRERATKHPATEVLEQTPLEEVHQSG